MTEETYELQLSGDGIQLIPLNPGSITVGTSPSSITNPGSITVGHILTDSETNNDVGGGHVVEGTVTVHQGVTVHEILGDTVLQANSVSDNVLQTTPGDTVLQVTPASDSTLQTLSVRHPMLQTTCLGGTNVLHATTGDNVLHATTDGNVLHTTTGDNVLHATTGTGGYVTSVGRGGTILSGLGDEHDGPVSLAKIEDTRVNDDASEDMETGEVNLFLEYGANWSEDLLVDLRNITGKVFDYPVFCVDGLAWSNKLVLASFGSLTKAMLVEAHEESCLVLPDVKKLEFEMFHRFLFEDSMDLTDQNIEIVSKVGHLLGVPIQDVSIVVEETCEPLDYQTLFEKQKYEYISKTLGIHESQDLLERLSSRKNTFRKAKWANLDRQLGGKFEHSQVTLSCDECGRLFSDNNLLNSHIETVHKIKEGTDIKKPFPCKYCESTFTFEANVKRHIFLVHPNGSQNKDIFAKRSKVAKVESICNDEEEGFMDLVNDINKDKENQFEKDDEFKCKVCGEYLKSRRFLVIHMTEHFDTKIGTHGYKCDYPGCTSSFKESSKLRRHKIIHTGDKPFQCEFCEMRFSFKHNMKMHVKTHTKEGLFSCKYCDYQTVQKINLKSHENTHSKMGHLVTADPQLQTEQQLSRPTHTKGKYSLSMQKQSENASELAQKVRNMHKKKMDMIRKEEEKQAIIEGFEEMEQDEVMVEKDLIIKQNEHEGITRETNAEIEKFIAEMERENAEEMNKSGVDMHQMEIKMQ